MKLVRLVSVLVFLALGIRAAGAHAIVLGSTPASGQKVAGDELSIEIRFNSLIDAHRSHLKLFKPDGTLDALLILDAASSDTLKARAIGLQPGAYRLHWQTLSPDGHITQGDIPFAVSR